MFSELPVHGTQATLPADFGRSLLWDEAFVAANAKALAFDLFTLTGCAP